jgi:hypothetical protein
MMTMFRRMEHHTLKCKLNTNIYSYLETSGGQSFNLYLNVVHLTPLLISRLWQLKTVAFLHWCLMRLCHPPDGSTSPKYKLLHFKQP